jgi:hypothetical protein
MMNVTLSKVRGFVNVRIQGSSKIILEEGLVDKSAGKEGVLKLKSRNVMAWREMMPPSGGM